MSEINDDFVVENIKRINELYGGEIILDKFLANNIPKNDSFALFDKEWLTKWKIIVDYENLKVKCKNCEIYGKISQELIDEVRSLFIKNNANKKLDDLGEMDCSILQKKIGNKILINVDSNFIPILSHQCAYFSKYIKKLMVVNAQISNGVIYIHDHFPEKNKEQKLILFYKDLEDNQEFIKSIITLEPNVKIQEVVKKLKTKKIDEILNQHEYKIETVKSNKIFYKEKCEEEKKLKEREETAFKSKEKKSILEEENKRKEEEEVKQRNNSQINNYIQQIVDLKKQLNDEKEKNKKLLVENNNLKEKIKELDNEINKIQGLEKQIKLLQNKLDQKNIEIQNILKTNKKPYEITSIEPGEKIIVVNFVSMATQEISNFGLECKNTDLFVSLEERLYEEFPQFKASDAYYLVNTKRIKRFLTLEQNGIKRNDIISIYFIEE